MKRSVYDLLYRVGAPWDGPPPTNLVRLVEGQASVRPTRLPPGRAIDLGCGTGANVRYLANHEYEAVGVDYSRVALEIARRRAAADGTPGLPKFIEGDLIAGNRLSDAEGPFDLLLDFGTLDDFDPGGRRAMARLVARPRAARSDLPVLVLLGGPFDLAAGQLSGPSRMIPVIEPGEEPTSFGDTFSIERLAEPDASSHTACFLMTRRWPRSEQSSNHGDVMTRPTLVRDQLTAGLFLVGAAVGLSREHIASARGDDRRRVCPRRHRSPQRAMGRHTNHDRRRHPVADAAAWSGSLRSIGAHPGRPLLRRPGSRRRSWAAPSWSRASRSTVSR